MTAAGRLTLRYAAKTDVGMRRNHNEDCFGIVEEDCLVLVADGMGGHAAGEVASGLATAEVGAFYHFASTYKVWPFEPSPALTGPENRLVCAFKVANRRIFETSRSDGGRRGMGTTLAAAAITDDKICVAHVGDSRVYRIQGGTITRLTRDHSLLEQFKEINPGMTREEENNFPHKNVITRALGLADDVEVDVKQYEIKAGDHFLLCSDGLSGHVTDEEILEIVQECGDDLKGAVTRLVDLANENGGNDNITVVLLCCTSGATDAKTAPKPTEPANASEPAEGIGSTVEPSKAEPANAAVPPVKTTTTESANANVQPAQENANVQPAQEIGSSVEPTRSPEATVEPSKAEPTNAVQPAKATEPANAAVTSAATEPANAGQPAPAKATEPVTSVESADATEPANAALESAIQPANALQSAKATEPANAALESATQPANALQSAKATQPANALQPATEPANAGRESATQPANALQSAKATHPTNATRERATEASASSADAIEPPTAVSKDDPAVPPNDGSTNPDDPVSKTLD